MPLDTLPTINPLASESVSVSMRGLPLRARAADCAISLGQGSCASQFAQLFAGFLVFGAANVLWHLYLSSLPQVTLWHGLASALWMGLPFVLLMAYWHTQHARTLAKLADEAQTDTLSGLYNRETFLARLRQAQLSGQEGVLLMIDADHFKQVNDRYGHPVGDRCIEAIGRRIGWHLRAQDFAGRLGGEEFAVFLDGASRAVALGIADLIGQPVAFCDAQSIVQSSVTLSIGAVPAHCNATARDWIIAGDQAMYRAKRAGRDRVVWGDPEDRSAA